MTNKPDRIEEAVSCFNNGFTCSQAVFSTYSGLLGLPRESALQIAEPFAMGMGRGETCGAVTGALMVLGLKYGRTQSDDLSAKELTRAKAKEFIQRFTQLQKSTVCNQLLEHDVSTLEGKNTVETLGYFNTRCPLFVGTAAKLVEELW